MTKVPITTDKELKLLLTWHYHGKIRIESIRPTLKSYVKFSFPKGRTRPTLN